MSKERTILIMTFSMGSSVPKHLNELDGVTVFGMRGMNTLSLNDELTDELAMRYDVIAIDGEAAGYITGDFFKQMMDFIHMYDMPTVFVSFTEKVAFPGVAFLGSETIEQYVARQ